jgi:hypothetical protein
MVVFVAWAQPPTIRMSVHVGGGRRVACGVWRVACGVCRVTCGVWRVTCDVCRVTCGVWLERTMQRTTNGKIGA